MKEPEVKRWTAKRKAELIRQIYRGQTTVSEAARTNDLTQQEIERNIPEPTPDRIIRAREVQEITGLSRTTLWRLENKGEFPHRVSLSIGSVGWRYNEVKEWVMSRS